MTVEANVALRTGTGVYSAGSEGHQCRPIAPINWNVGNLRSFDDDALFGGGAVQGFNGSLDITVSVGVPICRVASTVRT